MAQRVEVLLVDDIDGTEADETLTFALDGTTYEIDLSDAHAQSLRDGLAPFIKAGRRVSGAKAKSGGKRKSGSGHLDVRTGNAKAIRLWAKETGVEVPSHGRIPVEVRDKYEAAVGAGV